MGKIMTDFALRAELQWMRDPEFIDNKVIARE